MTIPSIIANLPGLKFFRQDGAASQDSVKQTPPENKADNTNTNAIPQDTVEISDTARQRLEGVKDLPDADTAKAVASETGEMLADTDVTLGLDPDFS